MRDLRQSSQREYRKPNNLSHDAQLLFPTEQSTPAAVSGRIALWLTGCLPRIQSAVSPLFGPVRGKTDASP
jgi:hypothetical protein